MANNFNAARAIVDAMGGPQPTPQGRDVAQDIAVRFNAYAGSGTQDVQRVEPLALPTGGREVTPQGVQPGWWKDKTFQKGAVVAGLALLVLWLQARNDRG